MAYAVTQAQLYIQSLGFTNVNNGPRWSAPTSTAPTSSFYDEEGHDAVGKGGVDDGGTSGDLARARPRDQDDQVPGFGVGHDSSSMGEGSVTTGRSR
jgi:hypothetical protein